MRVCMWPLSSANNLGLVIPFGWVIFTIDHSELGELATWFDHEADLKAADQPHAELELCFSCKCCHSKRGEHWQVPRRT